MKTSVHYGARMSALILSVVLIGQATAEEIALGDSMAKVIELLGEPQGRISSGTLVAIFYERGTVTFTDGKVTTFKLVSPEKAASRKAAAAQRQRQRQATAAAARLERIRTGQAELERVKRDASFEERSTDEQLTYWQSFHREYPEVSVSGRITALEQKLREEAEDERQVELAALESRIAETQARISEVANRSGMSRPALIRARGELARLREALPLLEKQRNELLLNAPESE